jgi:hypothetical protein
MISKAFANISLSHQNAENELEMNGTQEEHIMWRMLLKETLFLVLITFGNMMLSLKNNGNMSTMLRM